MSSSSAPITLSSLTYLQGKALAPLLLDPTEQAKIAVIDVRDSDHVGGNIKGSTWIPLNQLDVRIPELLRTLKDKEKVVFHCMLSQQRGPRAALMYARAKRAHSSKEQKAEQSDEEVAQGAQEVCVLEGGFGQWQAQFGEDPRLTADYVPDIWL
ncbi:Cdc25 phosphatase Ibp1 [Knufia peltigerae]|nr:Cdc25 phosphatase Ibp1 [Knufia peltigerae]